MRFSQPRRRPVLRWVLLIVVFFLLLPWGAMKYTSQAKFCSNCHEIKPSYVAWTKSKHNEVNCMKCHAEPGLAGYVKTKVGAMKELYLHVTGTYKKPIRAETDTIAFSNRCKGCHKDIAGRGDAHNKKHIAQDIPCTYCHQGLVHNVNTNLKLPSSEICRQCHPG